MTGLAVGAWVGHVVLGVATHGSDSAVGLRDLVRLHADVVAIGHLATAAGVSPADIAEMLARLDAAIDAVVAELDRARR
ncbi:MAG: hypothetical protein ACRDRK_13820 [Pseudonocardia sp.]